MDTVVRRSMDAVAKRSMHAVVRRSMDAVAKRSMHTRDVLIRRVLLVVGGLVWMAVSSPLAA